jgi:hypothetical protein
MAYLAVVLATGLIMVRLFSSWFLLMDSTVVSALTHIAR